MASSSSGPAPSVQIDDEASAFQQSSPLSLRQQPHSSYSPFPPTPPLTNVVETHDYNFSGAVYDESTSGAESECLLEETSLQEEDFVDTRRRLFSGCSSISSFPTSISHHLPPGPDQYVGPRTPSIRDSTATPFWGGSGGLHHPTTSPRGLREYPSPFRHPSSVRALQMKDEVMSDTHSVLRHHRRSGSQMSAYSQRSSYSTHTSTKRSNQSYRTSRQKDGGSLKKEFPLVLLHCTLLPPNLRVQSASLGDSLITELLPEEHRERWIFLRNKLADAEIGSRGVLIPHPNEDYGLLEERLLESLELETPRIRHNHYFRAGGSAIDSGFESGSITEDETDVDGSCDVKCPDCGHRLHPEEVNRKWEVRVFAANGLMRAGAWAAAWREMEKVDVEINIWLPEEIRQDMKAKLALLEAPHVETTQLDSGETWASHESISPREREVYGESGRLGSDADTSSVEEPTGFQVEPPSSTLPPAIFEQNFWAQVATYTSDFTRDRKNVVVGMLSLLILVFALAGPRQPDPESSALSSEFRTTQMTEFLTTTITTTKFATSTATVTSSVAHTTSVTWSPSEQADVLESISRENSLEQPSETNLSASQGPVPQDANIAGLSQLEVTATQTAAQLPGS